MKLSGKVALVTGSARGIGAATAKALAKEGANVVIADVKVARAMQTLHEIESFGGKSIVAEADISKEEEVSRMVAEANKTFGKIDILVNNAARVPIYNYFLQTTWEDLMWEVDVILKGNYLCTKAIVPGMIKRKWGRIININGSAFTHPFLQIYGQWIARGGALALSRTLALELAQHGITVNIVLPGLTKSELHDEWGQEGGLRVTPQDNERVVTEHQAIKRMGQPEDVSPAIVFLCTDEASFITGQALHVSGGMTIATL